MKILVIGATGGSGRAVTEELLHRGHTVTAFARHATALADLPGDARLVDGDATVPADLAAVVPGQDAVVVTLGISENTVRVRLRGPARTRADVRSAGTAAVMAEMERAGVARLVVQSSYGVGPTRDRLGLADRIFFALLIKPQIADTEVQEQRVRASALDWTIVQPVHLDDGAVGRPTVTTDGDVVGAKVSRRSVAVVLAETVGSADHVGRTLAVS